MLIKKYNTVQHGFDSGKGSENNPINIDTVAVYPKQWQYSMRDLPSKVKEPIYDKIRTSLWNKVKNPYQKEYDDASEAFNKLQRTITWPDNAKDIINNMGKAIDNYYGWDPLNSSEGYNALKSFYDNPGFKMYLTTYPYFNIPNIISHSRAGGTWLPTIDSQMSDSDYNLITNNCSDATKKFIEYVKGVKMPNWVVTTPLKVRKWTNENIKYKNIYNDNYYIDEIPLTVEEFNKAYNYEKKKNN